MERLRPGAVVVLPDHPDIGAAAVGAGAGAVGAGPAAVGLGGFVDVDATMAAARAVLSRGAGASERRHADLRKALGGRDLERAAAADPTLREEVTRVTSAVAEEQRLAAEWHATMAAALDHLQALDRGQLITP